MEIHRVTVGVFGIPKDDTGRGLWSKRADGKGVNAIGGGVDPEDVAQKLSLEQVLMREFREEADVEIFVGARPLGVFPNADFTDIAILYPVEIIRGGTPQPSSEAVEHIWMSPKEVQERAELYDKGDRANGLVSGVGKRQWQMAQAFFTFSVSAKNV